MTAIFVTAFYDIGRNSWDNYYNRNMDAYINSLNKIILNIDNQIVIFLDDRYLNKVIKRDNVLIIPINDEWLHNNTLGWKFLEVTKIIMNSEKYINLVGHKDNPEHKYPHYVTIVNCKLDFITIAYNTLKINTNYIWIDAGYLHTVDSLESNILFNKTPTDKILLFLVNSIIPQDFDIIHTLIHARPLVTGGLFIIPHQYIYLLYNTYFKCVKKLIDLNIVDDDQHILLQCIATIGFDHFNLIIPTPQSWPKSLTYLILMEEQATLC